MMVMVFDAPAGIRTRDLSLVKGLLYPLSYEGNRLQRRLAEATQARGWYSPNIRAKPVYKRRRRG